MKQKPIPPKSIKMVDGEIVEDCESNRHELLVMRFLALCKKMVKKRYLRERF